jgi:ribosomal protein S18 acetylase RimI-like enzyme
VAALSGATAAKLEMTGASMEVLIRRGTIADDNALSLVGQATILETYAGLAAGPDVMALAFTEHSREFYQALLSDPAVQIWVAETPTGSSIGYLVLKPPQGADHGNGASDVLEVKRIYILHRFHKLGIGGQLMKAALEAARLRRARQVVLTVVDFNDDALAFYSRFGFSRIGDVAYRAGNTDYHCYTLGIKLPE